MNKFVFIGVLLFLSQIAFGQEWLHNFDVAKKKAAETDNNIVLVFAGSDWCAPCIKLEKEIWNSSEFIKYSKEHFVLLKADFPRQKKNKLSKEQQQHNDLLAEKYDPEGYFPLVLILDAQGKVLGKTGYKKMTPEKYISLLNSFEG
ncbi:thioredoxin family protein [Reichenbachiella sp. MALMAid0571]|uniref:thioredoxin family protein n=1 Tax=Reichenbachiella sp. MALMAid0571 TaxID=3143939 RepID=UPI0032DE89B2